MSSELYILQHQPQRWSGGLFGSDRQWIIFRNTVGKVLIMHMSSACPWGRTPGQLGEYVGEYKGMNWLLCPWAGQNSRHCFEFEGKGWGNSKFCKITDANHGDIRGICRFPQPINIGNIKEAKRRIRVFELHNFYRGLVMTLLRTGNKLAHHPKWSRTER